jgi:hypothetical protein
VGRRKYEYKAPFADTLAQSVLPIVLGITLEIMVETTMSMKVEGYCQADATREQN